MLKIGQGKSLGEQEFSWLKSSSPIKLLPQYLQLPFLLGHDSSWFCIYTLEITAPQSYLHLHNTFLQLDFTCLS